MVILAGYRSKKMIEEQAKVIEVRNGHALVQTERTTACEGCSAHGACASLGGDRDARVWAEDGIGVERGEIVVVAIAEKTFLLASVLVYIMPVAALIVGAFIGTKVGLSYGYDPDLVAAGLGISAMVAALFAARIISRNRIRGPKIVRRVSDGQTR
jgi:sigma-E factor negative regulatory protein RseC